MERWDNMQVRITDYLWFQEGPGVRNTQYTETGVKLLNVANLVDGKVDITNTSRYISEEEAASLQKTVKKVNAKKQFTVIYEDDNVLIAQKPFGLLTHGDGREKKNHLANQVIDYLISTGEAAGAPAYRLNYAYNDSGLGNELNIGSVGGKVKIVYHSVVLSNKSFIEKSLQNAKNVCFGNSKPKPKVRC